MIVSSCRVALVAIFCWVPALAADAPRIQLGSKPSEILMAKITVSNLRRSLDFYTNVVGLKEVAIPGLPPPNVDDTSATGSLNLNFSGSAADAYLVLMTRKAATPSPESAKLTWVGFKVPDTQAVLSDPFPGHPSFLAKTAASSGLIF